MIVHRADLPDLPTDCNQLVKWGLVDEVSGVVLAIPSQVWAKRIRSDWCALNKTKYLVDMAECWFCEPAQAGNELFNGYFLRQNLCTHVLPVPSIARLLFQKHAIPVRIKPVCSFDRMPVGCQYRLSSSESTYQHQQRGLRQVEIGKQCADNPESVSRINKDASFSATRTYFA